MGGTISNICKFETQNNKQDTTEFKMEPQPVKSQAYSFNTVNCAIIIQNAYRTYIAKKYIAELKYERIKEFDENICKYGRYISNSEMNQFEMERINYPITSKFEIDCKEISKFKHVFTRSAFLFKDGSIYQGDWNYCGKKHGYGVFLKTDGSKYEGFWFNDKIHGRGRYIDSLGNCYEGTVFEFISLGNWAHGFANGRGVLTIVGGSKYDGNWINDLQEGYGEERFKDGSVYKGDYESGQKHGKGKFIWKDESFYMGDFYFSKISGKGTMQWKDGRSYEGDWLDNKLHGKGIFTWPDGKRYEGEYNNGKKEGQGTYYWSEDKYYTGQWVNNRQHGEGMYMINNKTLRGQFRFGKIIKKVDNESKSSAFDRSIEENYSKIEKDDSVHNENLSFNMQKFNNNEYDSNKIRIKI